MTERKSDRVLALAKNIKQLALNSDTEDAFHLGAVYGSLLWFNHVGIYRDDDVEQDLIKRISGGMELENSVASRSNVLHVVTSPLQKGGHTRLLERLACGQDYPVGILVTSPWEETVNYLNVDDGVRVYASELGYSIQDLVKIISAYQSVVLHIDPNDLKAVVAVGSVRQFRSIRVMFLNHADHVFSFGFSVVDVVAEVSAFGFRLSQKARGVASSFIGIPLSKGDFYSCSMPVEGNLSLLSAASEPKFRPMGRLSFPMLSRLLLRSLPEATLTLIGPDKKQLRWWLPRLLLGRAFEDIEILTL